MKKLRVAILFGGRSAEHQISLMSAKNVIASIDRDLFEPILIAIDKEGVWHNSGSSMNLVNPDDPKNISLGEKGDPIIISHNDHSIFNLRSSRSMGLIDVIYPVLHGTFGEDGSVQGLAKLANIPCVGCGILGSAVGMDKDIMKKILRDGGIGVADFFTFRKGSSRNPSYQEVVDKLGNELFLKPANLGSSVGVSFAKNEDEFNIALAEGFRYDRKVIVEEKVNGREIEVAVLGNDDPIASVPGEILPKSGWYSFENKYVDEDGAALAIPAKLDEKTTEMIRKAAIETYELLELSGMTRVDFFLKKDNLLIVNEVNTLPGFTSISMYPKLWEYSGIPKKQLITKLIHFAVERFNEEAELSHK